MNDMTAVDANQFNQEKNVSIKEKRYSVRDNGAVFDINQSEDVRAPMITEDI